MAKKAPPKKRVIVTKKTDADRRKSIETMLAKYGNEIVWVMDDKRKRPPIEVIPTKCFGVNWATDRGGVPRSRATMLQGRESSGKTTLAYHLIKVVQLMGGTAALIDVENSVDLRYMQKCGVRLDDTFFLAQPDYGEQAWSMLEELVESGQWDLIVLDSIAAMVPLAELQGKMTDQQMALQARINAKSARRLNTKLKGTRTALVYINQLRDKIGGFGYGPQTMTPGGRALKHAATIIIEMQPTKPIKVGERRVGFLTRLRVIKNKVGQPSRQVEIPITFNYGIDERLDLINMLLGAKILKQGTGKDKRSLYLDKQLIGVGWMMAWSYLNKNRKLKTAAIKRLKAYLAQEAVVLAMSSDNDE